jgi:D-threo-aldose 1-dehydrogenase
MTSRHSEKVKIKGTDLEITKLSLGSAPLSGLFRTVSDQESDELIQLTLDSGIRYIDSAPLYGYGMSERRIGRVARGSDKPYVLSTKVGRLLRPGKNQELDKWPGTDPNIEIYFDYSSDGIRKSLEDSYERFGGIAAPIIYIHDPEEWIPEAIDVVYPILDDLRSQGIIKAVGVGVNYVNTALQIIKETDLNIALLAGRYTLLDQSSQDELYPLAIKKNVSIVAAGVMNSGILANPKPGAHYDYEPAKAELVNRAIAIKERLSEFDIPLTAAALQFPLRHKAVTTVLIGAANASEMSSNIKDFDLDIPSAAWQSLEDDGLIQKVRNS